MSLTPFSLLVSVWPFPSFHRPALSWASPHLTFLQQSVCQCGKQTLGFFPVLTCCHFPPLQPAFLSLSKPTLLSLITDTDHQAAGWKYFLIKAVHWILCIFSPSFIFIFGFPLASWSIIIPCFSLLFPQVSCSQDQDYCLNRPGSFQHFNFEGAGMGG